MPEESGEGRPQGELTTEARSWYDRPHEELVHALKGFIEQRQALFPAFTPEEIIRQKLEWESGGSDPRGDFFYPIARAYDAIAYDHFEAGSSAEQRAAGTLNMYYGSTHEPNIKLDDPLQVKIVDALAEAINVPHRMGQKEIPIPPQLHKLSKWMLSDEYRQRVQRANNQPETARPEPARLASE